MKYTEEIVVKIIESFNSGKYKSSKEIANTLHIPDFIIRRYLNKNGLYFGHFSPFKSKDEINPNIELKEFIIGSLLGDGCITEYSLKEESSKNHNSKLTINHSQIQKDYVLYKQSLLNKYNCKNHITEYFRKSKSILNGREIKDNGNIILNTTQNVYFNKYRDLWYKNGTKEIPRNIVLTPLALAIWFMDDGYKSKGNYVLCTNGFTINDQKFLQNLLIKLNVNTTIQKHGIYHRLYVRTDSVENFTTLILPYICDSMKYKLHLPDNH